MAVQAQLCSESLGFSAYSSQDWMANPGFGFNGDFRSNQNQQQLLMNHLQSNTNQSMRLGSRDDQSMTFSQSLAAEFERQGREMDLYLRVQSVRFKYAIEQKRKQQMAALLNRVESKAMALVRQKELDLVKVKERTRELEGCLRRAEIEIEEWQRAAQEKEAMVINLNQMLLQVKERLLTAEAEAAAAAAESVNECEYSSTNNNNNNKRGKEKVEEIEGEKKMGCCKCCDSRSSSMVLLPCKHLCSCRFCEPFLEICPVCQCGKEASIEVFLQ